MKHDVEGNMFRFTWLIIGLLVIPADAAEWPQWRGPLGQGHALQPRICPINGKSVHKAKKYQGVRIFDGEQRYLAGRGRPLW